MLEEVDRLALLVDRLLTLSRADTGQSQLSVDAVDIPELAEEIAEQLGVLAEEKGQSLTVKFDMWYLISTPSPGCSDSSCVSTL